MKKLVLFLCLLSQILRPMAITGCKATKSGGEKVSPLHEEPAAVHIQVSCDEFITQKHIAIEVKVPYPGSLIVTLCSNPSTGFQWSELAEISDQTVLKQNEHKFVPPDSKGDTPPPPGKPGKEVWTFKSRKKGTCVISLEYNRPWEGGEKRELTFTLTVTAK